MKQFFKNKHVLIAMVVAPILALCSYFLTDYIVGEKPHIAKEDTSYKLRANSGCRWESGKCTLDNGDLEISITGTEISSRDLELSVTSSIEVSGVKLAFDKNGNELPMDMLPVDNTFVKWKFIFNASEMSENLNVAVKVNESIFYAQVSTIFLRKRKIDLPVIN